MRVITHDVADGFFDQALNHAIFHIVFGPSHPEDAAPGEIEKVPEVDVGFVKDDDFPCQNGCTEFSGAEVVIVAGCLDNGETRQEAADVEPQVEFGGGFAPPVLCP